MRNHAYVLFRHLAPMRLTWPRKYRFSSTNYFSLNPPYGLVGPATIGLVQLSTTPYTHRLTWPPLLASACGAQDDGHIGVLLVLCDAQCSVAGLYMYICIYVYTYMYIYISYIYMFIYIYNIYNILIYILL